MIFANDFISLASLTPLRGYSASPGLHPILTQFYDGSDLYKKLLSPTQEESFDLQLSFYFSIPHS
jgi:hypothetical protein